MGTAISSLSVIFIVVWFVLMVNGMTKGNKAVKKQMKNRLVPPVLETKVPNKKPRIAKPDRVRDSSYVRLKPEPAAKGKASALATNLEDRKHDWLARQLAEERALLIKGSLTDLGARHDRSCDAKVLKNLHILEHDDSIDEGEL